MVCGCAHQINPSLQRVLALAGADVERWFRDMPTPRLRAVKRGGGADDFKAGGQLTLQQYFLSQVRFCRYRFCATGELKYRGAVGRRQVHCTLIVKIIRFYCQIIFR